MRNFDKTKKRILEIVNLNDCHDVMFDIPVELYRTIDEEGKEEDDVLLSWLNEQSFTDKGTVQVNNKLVELESISAFSVPDTLTGVCDYCLIEVYTYYNRKDIRFSFIRKRDKSLSFYKEHGISF